MFLVTVQLDVKTERLGGLIILRLVGMLAHLHPCHPLHIPINQVTREIDLSFVPVEYFLVSQVRTQGFCLEAQHIGLNLRRSQVMLHCSAVAAIVMARRDLGMMLALTTLELLAAGAKAVAYYEELRYDETPMVTRMADKERSISSSSSTGRESDALAILKSAPFITMTC